MDVRSAMRRAARYYSRREAVVHGELRLSFAEAWARGMRMANALLGLGLKRANKTHDIAFIRNPGEGTFHHASFFVESWADIGHAADIIARNDVALDIGPTRHGITRGQTISFFDPCRNRNEVFSGGDQYDPDNPTLVWTEDQLGKAIFYYERELNELFMTVTT